MNFVSRFIDLTGSKFGKLTALYRDESFIDNKGRHRTMWCCQCECGREKSVRRDWLTSGKAKSCGMCNNDLTGKKFGKLTVARKVGTDKSGHLIWECNCDCGNNVNVLATNLIQEYTKSCGCLHSKICSENGENLIGKKFGKLTVISLDSISPRKFLCNCDCGGKAIVEPGNLKNGHTQSCGCISSLGEEKINSYLSSINISFKPEYCVAIDGFNGLARYDFVIFNEYESPKFLIEYHGLQHYQVAHSWNDTENDLQERQRKDGLKVKWAEDNNIPLYVIPYWDFENIERILDEIVGGEDEQ